MDTKRHADQEFKVNAGRLAREKIDTWKPDVVIACDDNAQIFVTQKYLNKRPCFVFCGVNASPQEYGFPAENVTGILERPHFQQSIDFLREICGYVKRLTVLSDRDPTSVGALEFMQQQSVSAMVGHYYLTDDLVVWQELVLGSNKAVDALCVYMYHTVKEKAGLESISSSRVMAWTTEHCLIPTIGFFDFAIEDGALCGVVESGEEHGYEAGQMTVALLSGKDIKTIPITTAVKGKRMLNMSTARKLKIEVPPGVLKTIEKVVE
jgi:ABC-type uncharacterized transport system substrate-binding protein